MEYETITYKHYSAVVKRFLSGQTWSQIRDGPGTEVNKTNHMSLARMYPWPTNPSYWIELSRGICIMDVSQLQIPADSQLVAANYSTIFSGKHDPQQWLPDLGIYNVDPSVNAASIAAVDYQKVGTIPYSPTKTFDEINLAGWTIWPLNSYALAILANTINGDGLFKIGLRNANYDVANIDPPAQTSQASSFTWRNYAMDQRLDIIYIPPEETPPPQPQPTPIASAFPWILLGAAVFGGIILGVSDKDKKKKKRE